MPPRLGEECECDLCHVESGSMGDGDDDRRAFVRALRGIHERDALPADGSLARGVFDVPAAENPAASYRPLTLRDDRIAACQRSSLPTTRTPGGSRWPTIL